MVNVAVQDALNHHLKISTYQIDSSVVLLSKGVTRVSVVYLPFLIQFMQIKTFVVRTV